MTEHQARRRPGRPPRAGERATKRLQVWLTSSERAALQKVAAENQLPLATVVREAMNSFVGDYGEGMVFLTAGVVGVKNEDGPPR